MKQVAILGTGASWVDAPFDNPEIEIWGLNYLNLGFEQNTKGNNRFTRWFHMHTREFLEPCIDFLKKLPIPLYTLQQYDDIPASVAYPIADVEAYFGRSLWRCSTGYMIALAIYEGYNRIFLYGVNMSYADDEYTEQKPSVEYWIGRAEDRGIEVIIPDSSDILKVPYKYGYENCPISQKAFFDKIAEVQKVKENLLKQKQKLENKIGSINAQLFKLDGALEISEYYRKLINEGGMS